MPVRLQGSDAVLAALDRVSRTEDLALTPEGDRLAVACYYNNEIALFDLDVRTDADGATVTLTAAGVLTGPAFAEPHGIAFLDRSRLVVANRAGVATLVAVPEVLPERPEPATVLAELLPEPGADAGDGDPSPGSLAVYRRGGDNYGVLVCSNFRHVVVQYEIGPAGVTAGRALLRRWLEIPDGVAVSADGAWIAVSNHNMNAVLLYRNEPALGPESDPTAILRGVAYPHGLVFSEDSRRLYVADAGSPYLHVYETDEDWAGVHQPVASCRAIDDAAFRRGRANPAEGGPKGLELHRPSGVLITTSEEQALAFLSESDLTAPQVERAGAAELVALELDRRAESVAVGARATAYERELQAARDELHRLAGELAAAEVRRRSAVGAAYRARAQRDRVRARAEQLVAEQRALRSSRSWRVTAPLRRLEALRQGSGERFRLPGRPGLE